MQQSASRGGSGAPAPGPVSRSVTNVAISRTTAHGRDRAHRVCDDRQPSPAVQVLPCRQPAWQPQPRNQQHTDNGPLSGTFSYARPGITQTYGRRHRATPTRYPVYRRAGHNTADPGTRPTDTSTARSAVDAFLSSARCANSNTRRAYAGALDQVLRELDPAADLAQLSGDQLAEVMERLWGSARRRPGTATVPRSPRG